MKTAISIPDQVFASAEELASRLGRSRSQLYAQALRSYLEQHSHDNVTEKLDEVYSRIDSQIDPVLHRLQLRSLRRGTSGKPDKTAW